ncbi:MAG TPA: thiamine pyrophosphate-dependent dehydrogenase E1 component subunit alpha [Solirubrobacterales bacterium]
MKGKKQVELSELLRRMVEIRAFEERIQRMFTQGLVRGTTHLCQGQEAVAVGACAALADGDTMTCTYRGHGAVLAMGAPLDKAFGEILGRAGGLCKGKGGSMHLTDVSVGALGSFAIVGAHLPISVGAAFTAKQRGTGALSLTFFGDGSTNIGAFHESMNLASIWDLPVIFMCENNLYGEYSPMALTTPVEELTVRASSYGMPATTVDGNDVIAVRDAVAAAADRARAGEGPTFIEALTYRFVGHSRSDPAAYRPEGELERWMERDPILVLGRRMVAEGGFDDDAVAAIRAAAEADVDAAAEEALSWPAPDPESRFEDVYA